MTPYKNLLTPLTHDIHITPKNVQIRMCPDFLNRTWATFCFFRGFEQLSISKILTGQNQSQHSGFVFLKGNYTTQVVLIFEQICDDTVFFTPGSTTGGLRCFLKI